MNTQTNTPVEAVWGCNSNEIFEVFKDITNYIIR